MLLRPFLTGKLYLQLHVSVIAAAGLSRVFETFGEGLLRKERS